MKYGITEKSKELCQYNHDIVSKFNRPTLLTKKLTEDREKSSPFGCAFDQTHLPDYHFQDIN